MNSSSLKIHFDAFEKISAGSASRRLYIDAEQLAGGMYGLIVRGEDYQIAGRTLTSRPAAMIHNEIDGSYNRYIVATGDREDIERAAGFLFTLYRGTGQTVGERLAAVPPEFTSMVLLVVNSFSVAQFSRLEGSISPAVSDSP